MRFHRFSCGKNEWLVGMGGPDQMEAFYINASILANRKLKNDQHLIEYNGMSLDINIVYESPYKK